MKNITSLVLFCLLPLCMPAQELYFPPLGSQEWESLDPDETNYCPDSLTALYDYLEETNTKAFILLENGKIAIEQYFNNFTQDSVWYWASAGKTMMAFLIGLAQEDGYLDIEDRSSDYLGNGWTSCTRDQEELITIRNQLTMTAALNLSTSFDCTEPECLRCSGEAGSQWFYHNAPYTLLYDVLQVATGQNPNIYKQQRLREETGIRGAFFPSGFNRVYFSDARSMARFGLLLYANGSWDGTEILSDTSYLNDLNQSSQNLNLSYGYLTWLNGKESYIGPGMFEPQDGPLFPDAPHDMYSAIGKNSQILNIAPSSGMIMVRLGDDPEANSEETVPLDYNNELWKKISGLQCQTSSTQDVNDELDFTFYPNPVSSILQITTSADRPELQIIDSTGRLLSRTILAGYKTQISTDHLPPGMYYMRLTMAQGTVVRKFFKQ